MSPGDLVRAPGGPDEYDAVPRWAADYRAGRPDADGPPVETGFARAARLHLEACRAARLARAAGTAATRNA